MCLEAWGSYLCECPNSYGGKDCSQNIEPPRRLKGSSYLLYDMYSSTPWTVQLPWYNGISFRTRQATGPLMTIEFSNNNDNVRIEVRNYTFKGNTVRPSGVQKSFHDCPFFCQNTTTIKMCVIIVPSH